MITFASLEDRERRLWIASQQYVKGEIEIEDLEAIESIQTKELGSALISISKLNIHYKLKKTLRELFRGTRYQFGVKRR